MNEDAVKVAVRIRPLIKSENERGCQTCLDVVPGEPQIVVCNTAKAFTFNYVFPPNATQEEFYNTAVKSMVQNIFQGKIILKHNSAKYCNYSLFLQLM